MYSTDSAGVQFNFRKARGTLASPSALQSGDIIGNIQGWGYGATAFWTGARIRYFTTENWTDAAQGSAIEFATSANGTNSGAVERMRVDQNGNVGIGTSAPQYTLSVNGTIGTKEVIVTNTGWADYVFKPDFSPMSLAEIDKYIEEHHHLPGIPAESEVQEKGVSLGDLQVKLLAKIEELTLHMIDSDARTKRLEEENRELQEKITRIENAWPVSER